MTLEKREELLIKVIRSMGPETATEFKTKVFKSFKGTPEEEHFHSWWDSIKDQLGPNFNETIDQESYHVWLDKINEQNAGVDQIVH